MTPKKLVPWIAAAAALAGAGIALVPPRPVRGFDVVAFARLPVLEGGRVKPVDSVARNALLVIRGAQSFRHEGRTVGPDEWLLDMLFRPDVAADQKVFRIDDPDVLGLVGLPQTSERYFSFRTLGPHLEELQRQGAAAQPIDAKKRTRFQSAVLNLYERAWLYARLENTVQLAGSAGLIAELASTSGPVAAQRQAMLAQLSYFRPILPPPGASPDAWRSVGEALRAAASGPAD